MRTLRPPAPRRALTPDVKGSTMTPTTWIDSIERAILFDGRETEVRVAFASESKYHAAACAARLAAEAFDYCGDVDIEEGSLEAARLHVDCAALGSGIVTLRGDVALITAAVHRGLDDKLIMKHPPYTPAQILAMCREPWMWALQLRAAAKGLPGITSVTPINLVVQALQARATKES
jgi:hypothetical protein